MYFLCISTFVYVNIIPLIGVTDKQVIKSFWFIVCGCAHVTHPGTKLTDTG